MIKDNIIAKAGEWRIRDGKETAIVLTEKFNPNLYDLTGEYLNKINSYIKSDKCFYIEILEDNYYIAI